jgi:hypothetical protein
MLSIVQYVMSDSTRFAGVGAGIGVSVGIGAGVAVGAGTGALAQRVVNALALASKKIAIIL